VRFFQSHGHRIDPGRAGLMWMTLFSRRGASAMTEGTDHPADLSETAARQGAWGQDVFWVLAFSTVLAIIILAAAWIWRAPQLAGVGQGPARDAAVAQTFHTPAQAHPAPALEGARQNPS
jgi:hypothetical protein